MTIQAAPDGGGRADGSPVDAPGPAVGPEVVEREEGSAAALITEQEVLLGSAAALHRAPDAPPRRAPKRYPPRSASYYDSSLVSREGYRL